MESKNSIKRLDFVDLLKTNAIFSVVIYHASSDMYGYWYADIIRNPQIGTYIHYFFNALLSTCVPLFFFVNGGLLLNKKHLNIKKHIYTMIKIVIIMFIWAMITIVALSFIREKPLPNVTKMLFNAFYLKQWNWHLWFLRTLVSVYIFYPLLFISFQNNKKVFYFFFCCVCIFTFGNMFIGQGLKFFSIILNKFNGVAFESKNYFSNFNIFHGDWKYGIGYFMLGGILFQYKNLFQLKLGKWGG